MPIKEKTKGKEKEKKISKPKMTEQKEQKEKKEKKQKKEQKDLLHESRIKSGLVLIGNSYYKPSSKFAHDITPKAYPTLKGINFMKSD